jgi:hypothetical protein
MCVSITTLPLIFIWTRLICSAIFLITWGTCTLVVSGCGSTQQVTDRATATPNRSDSIHGGSSTVFFSVSSTSNYLGSSSTSINGLILFSPFRFSLAKVYSLIIRLSGSAAGLDTIVLGAAPLGVLIQALHRLGLSSLFLGFLLVFLAPELDLHEVAHSFNVSLVGAAPQGTVVEAGFR